MTTLDTGHTWTGARRRAPAPLTTVPVDRSTTPRLTVLEVWIWLNVAAVSVLAMYLATSARFTHAQKQAQAWVFVWIFVSALLVVISASKRHASLVIAVYAVMAVFAIPTILQPYFSASWFVGDVLLLSTPALVGIGLLAATDLRRDTADRALKVFLAALLCASVLSSYFPDVSDSNRFTAPAPVLMAAVWVYLFARGGGHQLIAGAGVVLVGMLTWFSQWRSSVVVFFILGFVAMWFLKGPLKTLLAVAIGILVVGAAVAVVSFDPGAVLSDSNRLVRSFSGTGLQADSSVKGRFSEARAVQETVDDEWTVVNYVFGAGHGATYNTRNLETLPDSVHLLERNESGGRVHNIHLGPLLVFYRYGLLGVVAVLALFALLGRHLIAAARIRDHERFLVALGLVGCVLIFMVVNVTNQIQFSLTAAVMIALASPRRLEGLASAAGEARSKRAS